MSPQHPSYNTGTPADFSRRQFLGSALGAAALCGTKALADTAKPEASKPQRTIKLGVVGCGGRGGWIADLFKKNGGYEMFAVADYFQTAADRLGDRLKVDQGRRFSGLSGYKRLLESGVEAVALIVPPYFLPEQSSAAAEAGIHVYMAKPVAIDVHGARLVEAAGKRATQQKRVFFVDYQMPTDPVINEVVNRVHNGELGKLAKIVTTGTSGGHKDPPKTANLESRLAGQNWDSDLELSGSYILAYDIHAVDVALWVTGKLPIAAMGSSQIARENPHGTSHDVLGVVYEYDNGLFHVHSGIALPTGEPSELSCRVFGPQGSALMDYYTEARFTHRSPNGKKTVFTDKVTNLYQAGAMRNIKSFHDDVTAGRFDNASVARAVDGCLTCILGREAALRHGRLTMEAIVKEDRRIEPDLSGLKV
jgi:myo-inositol 2-dehydrogenase / D-chiro-inositol 1-dehydrogenase